ncbi:Phosphocarrier protein HPr [Limihaloglobus sulfuriphilus]|uniref:Phosphocarrier protein HPr n=1 Tax=Limihaloglobus sulfuriphilus TaxID=1851148 RepID=A0A1Q2MGQ6_9BACT|nr:HPr family phosphocarrier protein [Limihaloglobus sulfuriphilus]AQQ71871.1 Phosphocarrier protein HPr [Limihaloglobus sulfuriphilus]
MAEVREIHLELKNEDGLHMRPATLFTELATRFRSKIEVSHKDFVADGKSIMHILMLGAGPGAKLKITASGEDAEDAINAIHDLVAVKMFDLSQEQQ